MYESIIASLQEDENQKIEEWRSDDEASSQAKLKLPLLIHDTNKSLLRVNFDPALVTLLLEVKYLLLLGLTVPRLHPGDLQAGRNLPKVDQQSVPY